MINSSEPLISVVLPVFNGEQYLEQSIKSCLQQTYESWELIIVDDASNDATPQIILKYCSMDSRIRSIKHTINRKLPASLNTGFRQAQGALLTWTSDDNLYRPHAFEKMVQFLKENPEIDVVYSDFARIDESGNISEIQIVKPIEELVFGNVVGACFLYRRAVQDYLAAYSENFFLAEDYDFWLRASMNFHFAALHEVLYEYRVHQKSLTANYSEQISMNHEKTLEKNLPGMRWAGEKLVVERWILFARRAYEKGNYRKMFKRLGYAFVISPIHSIKRLLHNRF